MPRFALSLVAGSTITVFLFFFLYTLISAGTAVFESAAPAQIEFTRLTIADDLELKKRFKPEHEKPEPPPPTEGIVQTQTEEVNTISKIDLAPVSGLLGDGGGLSGLVTGRAGGGLGPTGTSGADQQVMPLIRIDAQYPESARMRGIEGWVLVQFTITKSGSVRNARVIAREPSSIFDRSALQAVRRYKYSPQVENGQAVEKTIQLRIRFQLPKGKE